jgi:hypothetical protein
MAQNISGDMVCEDESGNIIEAQNISIQEIHRLIHNNISSEELQKTFCLQFIDPWGDTLFNRLQLAYLIKEFEQLHNNCRIKEEKERLLSIINFITKAEETHTFIKFFGD